MIQRTEIYGGEAEVRHEMEDTHGVFQPGKGDAMTKTDGTTATVEAKLAPLRFRKRPVVIEAMQHDGSRESLFRVQAWLTEHVAAFGRRPAPGGTTRSGPPALIIPTLEGDHTALPGDWIIKGVAGEFYLCKPEIFEQTYEPVA